MNRWKWTLLLLLIPAAISCSRRSKSGSQNGGDNGDWLRVSMSAADIDKAAELSAAQQGGESNALLEHPEQILYVDKETEATLLEHREPVIEKLAAVIDSNGENKRQRLGAASLLARLGDERGREVLAETLNADEVEHRSAALVQINRLHTYYDESQPHIQFLLAHPPMAALILQQLDHADPRVQKSAIQTNGMLNVPGHVEKFRALIHRDGYADRGRLAYWLAHNGQADEVIGDIAKFFREGMTGDDAYQTVGSLSDLAERGDEKVRRQLMDLVREYYQRTDLDHAKLDPSVGWQLTSLVAKYAGPESADWLKGQLPVLRPSERGDVYQALARLEADGWRQILLQALREKETALYAARVVGEKFRGTQNTQIVAVLTAALDESESEHAISSLCEALIAVGGGEAKAAAQKRLHHASPWSRMDLIWELRGITLETVQQQVVESGLLTRFEFATAAARLESGEQEEDHTNKLMALLIEAERLVWFDAETGELPCRHDKLLLDFAKITRGVFEPEHVSETWNQTNEDDYEADYTLRFVFRGRCYEARLRNHGDWYDVERLVAAANRALADASRPERFVPLYSGGQDANFIFGEPQKLQQLALHIGLPIDDDASRAMNEGKAFERRVLEQYQEEGVIVQ